MDTPRQHLQIALELLDRTRIRILAADQGTTESLSHIEAYVEGLVTLIERARDRQPRREE